MLSEFEVLTLERLALAQDSIAGVAPKIISLVDEPGSPRLIQD